MAFSVIPLSPTQVEKIFRKSVEFCNESDTWKLNVAHVLFMQENKFKEATGFYEPIVRKNFDRYFFGIPEHFFLRVELSERCWPHVSTFFVDSTLDAILFHFLLTLLEKTFNHQKRRLVTNVDPMGEVLNDDDSWNSSILNVSAIVLANLCVSYIMTSQNEEAEELMRKIEKV